MIKEIGVVLYKHKINYGLLYFMDTGEAYQYGDKNSLEENDLVDHYLSNSKNIEQLDEYLDGAILPQSISQGNFKCIMHKPANGIILLMFKNHYDKNSSFYAFTKPIAQEVDAIVAKTKIQ